MKLVCPAGSLPAVKAAINNGADAIYMGFKDDTNARHFSGLNFNHKKIAEAIRLIQKSNRQAYIAINTYPNAGSWEKWQVAVDTAADLGIDAMILADVGLMEYAHNKHPHINIHLSVQGSATSSSSLNFYQQNFNIKRAVIPRVLSLKQVENLVKESRVEIETFAFGSLCIMAEGRCHLSSYLTGESPNMNGVCSPAKFVQWENKNNVLSSRLNDVLIDRYGEGEKAGYPTLCKGRFLVDEELGYALEKPTSLNTIDLIPELGKAGVKALKLEGRQRSPSYVEQAVRVWRQAIDAYLNNPEHYHVQDSWRQALTAISEGAQTTLGAYERPWQ